MDDKIVLTITICMMLVLSTVNVEAVEMSIPSLSGEPGSAITFPINIDELKGITGGDITLNYDNTILTAKKVRKTEITKSLLVASNIVENKVIIAMAGTTGIGEGDGTLFEVDFDVSPDAPANAKSDIVIAEADMFDKLGHEIPVTMVNGSFTVKEVTPPEYPRWDVNEDGVVDIADLVLVGKHFGEDYRQIAAMAKMTDIRPKADRSVEVRIKTNGKVDSQRILRIDVEADKALDLYGYQFDLTFDADALKVIGVTPGTMLADGRTQTYWTVDMMDNKSGRILGITQIRRATPYGASDSGLLASIVFEVKDVQKSTLLKITKVDMADSNARKLSVTSSELHLNWEPIIIPQTALLLQNYPNPFNPETWIPYHLAQDEEVTIRIYDVMGRVVRTIQLGSQPAGIYVSRGRAAYWDGLGNDGELVANGVYFYSIQAGDFVATRRLVILK